MYCCKCIYENELSVLFPFWRNFETKMYSSQRLYAAQKDPKMIVYGLAQTNPTYIIDVSLNKYFMPGSVLPATKVIATCIEK